MKAACYFLGIATVVVDLSVFGYNKSESLKYNKFEEDSGADLR